MEEKRLQALLPHAPIVSIVLLLILVFVAGKVVDLRSGEPFVATAYAISGVTKSGEETGMRTVAVDPRVIPLGSMIRVYDAGKYSGVYEATDTGRNIRGRRIDIFIEDRKEAREFGRREVKVEILQSGA